VIIFSLIQQGATCPVEVGTGTKATYVDENRVTIFYEHVGTKCEGIIASTCGRWATCDGKDKT
jgi:hypothetical protein